MEVFFSTFSMFNLKLIKSTCIIHHLKKVLEFCNYCKPSGQQSFKLFKKKRCMLSHKKVKLES